MAISRQTGGVLAGRFVLGGTRLPDPSGGSIESPGLQPSMRQQFGCRLCVEVS